MKQPNRRQRLRRNRNHQHDQRDRWMITYADLITLLLIFFVVMYAMSRLDTEKYELVTHALQSTFKSGDSVLEMGSGVTGTADTEKHKNPPPTVEPTEPETPKGEEPLSQRELAFRAQEEELAGFMEVIRQYVADNQLEEDIFIADEPQGIAITLSDRFLFDVAERILNQEPRQCLANSPPLRRP